MLPPHVVTIEAATFSAERGSIHQHRRGAARRFHSTVCFFACPGRKNQRRTWLRALTSLSEYQLAGHGFPLTHPCHPPQQTVLIHDTCRSRNTQTFEVSTPTTATACITKLSKTTKPCGAGTRHVHPALHPSPYRSRDRASNQWASNNSCRRRIPTASNTSSQRASRSNNNSCRPILGVRYRRKRPRRCRSRQPSRQPEPPALPRGPTALRPPASSPALRLSHMAVAPVAAITHNTHPAQVTPRERWDRIWPITPRRPPILSLEEGPRPAAGAGVVVAMATVVPGAWALPAAGWSRFLPSPRLPRAAVLVEGELAAAPGLV